MSNKNKNINSITIGFLIAVLGLGLGLVYKIQTPDSQFIKTSNNSKPITKHPSSFITKNEVLATDAKQVISNPKQDIAGKMPTISASIKSLKGTQIHGDLRIDKDGNLIIEKQVKQLFDYFLNVTGEIPRDQLIRQIKAGISDYLAEPAQSQALELLTNYLNYQRALQEEINSGLYQFSPGNIDDMETTYQIRSQLRSFHLGNDAATIFFKDEEARDWYTVGKLRLNANTDLNEEERSAELAALESSLPESHLKVLNKQRSREQISSTISSLRKENASIYELREEWGKHYDNEAVERFTKLENSRNQWNNRYTEYLQKRALILSAGNNHEQALSQLKTSMFNEIEIKRINTKDKITALALNN